MKRSNDTRTKHVKEAKRLLSLGYRPGAVALRLERLYGMSRATSFRDVETASAEMEASAQHNVQELMQLSRAFERLHRMGGNQSQTY